MWNIDLVRCARDIELPVLGVPLDLVDLVNKINLLLMITSSHQRWPSWRRVSPSPRRSRGAQRARTPRGRWSRCRRSGWRTPRQCWTRDNITYESMRIGGLFSFRGSVDSTKILYVLLCTSRTSERSAPICSSASLFSVSICLSVMVTHITHTLGVVEIVWLSKSSNAQCF